MAKIRVLEVILVHGFWSETCVTLSKLALRVQPSIVALSVNVVLPHLDMVFLVAHCVHFNLHPIFGVVSITEILKIGHLAILIYILIHWVQTVLFSQYIQLLLQEILSSESALKDVGSLELSTHRSPLTIYGPIVGILITRPARGLLGTWIVECANLVTAPSAIPLGLISATLVPVGNFILPTGVFWVLEDTLGWVERLAEPMAIFAV